MLDLHFATTQNDEKALMKHLRFPLAVTPNWVQEPFVVEDDNGQVGFWQRGELNWHSALECVHHMLQRVKSIHISHKMLKPAGEKKSSSSSSSKPRGISSCHPGATNEDVKKRQEGNNFIRNKGSVHNKNSEQIEWVDIQGNWTPQSAIFGWNMCVVKEVLANKLKV